MRGSVDEASDLMRPSVARHMSGQPPECGTAPLSRAGGLTQWLRSPSLGHVPAEGGSDLMAMAAGISDPRHPAFAKSYDHIMDDRHSRCWGEGSAQSCASPSCRYDHIGCGADIESGVGDGTDQSGNFREADKGDTAELPPDVSARHQPGRGLCRKFIVLRHLLWTKLSTRSRRTHKTEERDAIRHELKAGDAHGRWAQHPGEVFGEATGEVT